MATYFGGGRDALTQIGLRMSEADARRSQENIASAANLNASLRQASVLANQRRLAEMEDARRYFELQNMTPYQKGNLELARERNRLEDERLKAQTIRDENQRRDTIAAIDRQIASNERIAEINSRRVDPRFGIAGVEARMNVDEANRTAETMAAKANMKLKLAAQERDEKIATSKQKAAVHAIPWRATGVAPYHPFYWGGSQAEDERAANAEFEKAKARIHDELGPDARYVDFNTEAGIFVPKFRPVPDFSSPTTPDDEFWMGTNPATTPNPAAANEGARYFMPDTDLWKRATGAPAGAIDLSPIPYDPADLRR